MRSFAKPSSSPSVVASRAASYIRAPSGTTSRKSASGVSESVSMRCTAPIPPNQNWILCYEICRPRRWLTRIGNASRRALVGHSGGAERISPRLPPPAAGSSVRRFQCQLDPHHAMRGRDVDSAPGASARQCTPGTESRRPVARFGRQRLPAHYCGFKERLTARIARIPAEALSDVDAGIRLVLSL